MSASTMIRTRFSPELIKNLGVKISRLVTDSRQVKKGDTFVAYPGAQVDGRQFIAQAIAQGANAIIWEAQNFIWNKAWRVPNLAVKNLRDQSGEIAALVSGMASEKLWMVGVTGTNGKTSCSHWLAQSFGALNRKSALIGTLGNGFPPELKPTLNTTPDAIRVHGLLAEFEQQGAETVVMEVSSHALEQGRVNGVNFDVALLTNLSRDHLDYHGDMSSYAAAKRRLFAWENLKFAVLNLDDAFGRDLAAQCQDAEVEVIAYGVSDQALEEAKRLGVRMVFGAHLQLDARGCSMKIQTSWGAGELNSALLGRFNAENLLGALAVLLVSDVPLADALSELSQRQAVVGRMQTLAMVGKPVAVIDYAHTPDALEKVLKTLHEVTAASGGKLICVFGCGGDRDRGKRPMMGVVAGKFADMCIVTSDNPRSEEPAEIIAAIVQDMPGNYRVIEDRKLAIEQALNDARQQDTVLIAGKGHEDYQEKKGVKYPFSDLDVAQRCLSVWPLRQSQDDRGGKE